MDKVATIKAQYNFRDVAERMVSEITGKGSNFTQHACLFCQSSDAFTLYEESYYCYSCEASGDVIDLLAYQNKQTVGDFLRGNDCNVSALEIETLRFENAQRAKERKEAADREYKNALDRLHEVRAWIRYNETLMQSEKAQQLWSYRGLPLEWQAYFELGYCDNFRYQTKEGLVTSQTLTIPVKKIGGEVVTVRHRILRTTNGDKYRPDISGLGAHPFICSTELNRSENLLIVEGEIKSMVTFKTLDRRDYQVIGVPSKSMMTKVVTQSAGRKNVVVIPDPDGVEDAKPIIRKTGARLLQLPDKVDDLINKNKLSTRWLNNAIAQARRI